MKLKIRYIFISIIIILVDQFFKFKIINFEKTIGINKLFTISNYTNTAQAYSLGVDSIILLLAINILIIYLLIKVLIRGSEILPDATKFGIVLILAGEFSNLFDRIFRGLVVKYMKLFNSIPINISHISISCGIIMIITATLVTMIKSQEKDITKKE